MTDKELKRLGRADLLEMLLAQVKENEQMKIRLDEMKAQLDNKQIKIEKAGSLAEATLQLNGVVDAVEAAAAQYLENIQQRSNEGEAARQRMEEEAREQAEAIRAEADAYSRQIRAEADAYSRQTRSQADQYQAQVMEKIQTLLKEQEGLRFLLHSYGKEQET